MRAGFFLFGSILAGSLPVFAAGAAYSSAMEWEATMPATVRHSGLVEFHGAVEAGNGDLFLAGKDAEAEFFVRLDPGGRPRWISRKPHPGPYGANFLGIYETAHGPASLWGCCGNPGWTVVRYGDAGQEALRMDLGYPRGLLDISSDGQVVFVSSVMPAPGEHRTRFSAEGRSLAGPETWKTDLAGGILDEVIGSHALGDGSVAAMNRLGNRWGDTLKLWKLDRAGKVTWSRDLPVGLKAEEYLNHFSVTWTHIAHDPSGRVLVAGLPLGLPSDDPPPDSLALAALGSDGTPLWMKRLPLQDRGGADALGYWEILDLSAAADGIRILLYRRGSANYWTTADLSWSGEFLAGNPSPLGGGAYGFFRALPTGGGAWLGFGSAIGAGGIPPVTALDSLWRPTALSTPILYGPQKGPEGEWRKRALAEYADTLWIRKKDTPSGAVPDQTAGPGLEFLVFTRDGGALAGGRLWRRNGKDTLSVIAVKLPPAEVGIRLPRPFALRPAEPRQGTAFRIDAAGRRRELGRSPLFIRPAPVQSPR